MANEQQVKQLNAQITEISKFKQDELITRAKWGEITFEAGRKDFERIFGLTGHMQTLPIELLPDNVIQNIINQVQQTAAILQQIDQFNLASGNPAGVRDQYLQQLHGVSDGLFSAAAQWIPFLAYQRGDVARNIKSLTDAVTEAEKVTTEAKGKIEQRAKEIDEIITKAREASAAAGAAVFTRDFQRLSENLDRDSSRWLNATAIAAVVTLLTALGMWVWTEGGLDQAQIIQKLSTKLVILAVLLTATIWCGRNYTALKHLATINGHRAMSIQTLQAFSSAAADKQAKDAVLLEATRAVFGNVPTGYIEGGSNDGELKIIEVARSILPKSDK